MKYYVYIFLDPRKPGNYQYGELKFNHEPFYVGKGKDNRFQRHLNLSQLNSNHNPHKERILKKILKAGFNPLNFVEILHENLLEEEASSLEKQEIKTIGRSNLKLGPLTNLTDGGEGMSGNLSALKGKTYEEIYGKELALKMKEERRRRISGDKNPMFGKESPSKGKRLSKERIELMRKRASIEVNQLDKYGNLIKTWESIISAARSLEVSSTGITNVLSLNCSKSLSCAGFYWEYKDKRNEKYYTNNRKQKFFRIESPAKEIFYSDGLSRFMEEKGLNSSPFRKNALNPKKPRNKKYTYLYDDWNYWVISEEDYKSALGIKFY